MSRFKKAVRKKMKARVAIQGPSGSGKTAQSLRFAYGLAGDWGKIGVIDTENESAGLYVNSDHTGGYIGEFLHAPMEAPYTVDKFIEYINDAEQELGEGGVLIIDSFSMEWERLLEWQLELGGKFHNWKEPKKAHKRLIQKILASPLHVIVTVRVKQGYAIVEGGGKNGGNGVEKLGMKPIQSDELEYEWATVFNLTHENHHAKVSKDRTGLFIGMDEPLDVQHGEMLLDWLDKGLDVPTYAEQKRQEEAERQELVREVEEAIKDDEIHAIYKQWYVKLAGRHARAWPKDKLELFLDKVVYPRVQSETKE